MTEGSWPWPEEMDGVLAAPGSHQVLIDNDRVRVREVSIGPASPKFLSVERSLSGALTGTV
jgi:hypothetical protein